MSQPIEVLSCDLGEKNFQKALAYDAEVNSEGSLISDPEAIIERETPRVLASRIVGRLSPEERAVYEAMFIHHRGTSKKNLANLLDIGQSRLNSLLNTGMEKMLRAARYSSKGTSRYDWINLIDDDYPHIHHRMEWAESVEEYPKLAKRI